MLMIWNSKHDASCQFWEPLTRRTYFPLLMDEYQQTGIPDYATDTTHWHAHKNAGEGETVGYARTSGANAKQQKIIVAEEAWWWHERDKSEDGYGRISISEVTDLIT